MHLDATVFVDLDSHLQKHIQGKEINNHESPNTVFYTELFCQHTRESILLTGWQRLIFIIDINFIFCYATTESFHAFRKWLTWNTHKLHFSENSKPAPKCLYVKKFIVDKTKEKGGNCNAYLCCSLQLRRASHADTVATGQLLRSFISEAFAASSAFEWRRSTVERWTGSCHNCRLIVKIIVDFGSDS